MLWKIIALIIILIIIASIYLIYHKFYDIKLTFFGDNTTSNNKNDNKNGVYIDDVSQFNKTKMHKIFIIKDKDDIYKIIKDAHKFNKQISIRGTNHTMGGHTIVKNGYLIDTTQFNKVLEFDKDKMEIIVQPGMT